MEEALIKRVIPHSIEAEQSVVGAMLMDKDAITAASEMISGSDFYQSAYGIIFDSMVELFNEGKPVDLITLQERLREKDVPPEIASLEFVRDLVTAVPTSANVKYYAQIVADKAMMRRLIKLNEEIENVCYAGKEPLEAVLEKTEKSVFELLQRRNTGEYVPIRQVVLNALERIEKASKNKGTVTGIPTGFIDLDYKLSGLQPSDLILVAARPSMGKTAFVLNIAQYVAFKKNRSVAIFSLEMSKEQLVNRLFSLESQVDAQALKEGHGVLGGKSRERPVEELPAPGAGGHHLLRRAVVGHVAAALAGDAHLAPQLPVLVKQAHRKAPLQGGARGHQPGGAAAHY